MVDLNHGSGCVPGRAGNGPSLSERINRRVDVALLEAREAEPPRHYLGASVLGDLCARRVAYAWRGEVSEVCVELLWTATSLHASLCAQKAGARSRPSRDASPIHSAGWSPGTGPRMYSSQDGARRSARYQWRSSSG